MFKSPHFWKVWLPPHIMALIGLWFYHDGDTLFYFLCFYVLLSGLGIAVGFHRYLSHRAFTTNWFWRELMLYTGCLACQGAPVFWVALHRGLHHAFTDTERDPHSPIHGRWQAYQGYSFDAEAMNVPLRAAGDLLRDKSISNYWTRWMSNHYPQFLWTAWIAYGALSWYFDVPQLFVGLVCAQVWAINQEAIINLFGHSNWLGAKPDFKTGDLSVNRPWLALITWGQALHNNHHHNASIADFAFYKRSWWWVDPSMLIVALIRTNKDVKL